MYHVDLSQPWLIFLLQPKNCGRFFFFLGNLRANPVINYQLSRSQHGLHHFKLGQFKSQEIVTVDHTPYIDIQ